jgi:hypothetical protein
MGHFPNLSTTYPQAVDKAVDKQVNILQNTVFFPLAIALHPGVR